MAAKEKQAEVEKEKLAKEILVHKILNEQEGIMDSLAKEASQIQKEAEKNSKVIRNFGLMINCIFNIFTKCIEHRHDTWLQCLANLI